MKKLSLSIAIALILAIMLSLVPVTVMAADFNLGNFTYSGEGTGNPTFMGWCTDGRDGIATNLSIDTLKSATGLRIEFSAAIESDITFIMQSAANWWDQKDGIAVNGTVLNIDLTAMSAWSAFVASADTNEANFFIGDWNQDLWATISIVSAVLTGVPDAPAGGGAPEGGGTPPPPGGGEAPAPGGDAPAPEGGGDEGGAAPEGGGEVVVNEAPAGDDGKDNPKSGDSLLFPVILVALAGAAVLTVRKVRAK